MMGGRRLLLAATVLLLCIAGHLVGLRPALSLEDRIFDLFCRWQRPPAPNPDVVIVAIDDASLERYGRWPWPRTRMAALVHRLSLAKAKAVGIDISFLPAGSQARPGGSNNNHLQLRRWLRIPPGKYAPDEVLALALRRAANVVLPFYFKIGKTEAGGGNDSLPQFLRHSAYLLFDDPAGIGRLPLLRGEQVFAPVPALGESAVALGTVNAFIDADGVLRRDPAIIRYRDHYFPCFGIQVARVAMGLGWGEVKVKSDRGIVLGDLLVPADRHGLVRLNYYGGPGAFSTYSFAEVMSPGFDLGRLQDKIVLVGVTAAGLHDIWRTPLSPAQSGVEKHATVVANILDQRFLARSDATVLLELLLLLTSAALLVALGRRPAAMAAAALVLVCMWLGGSYWLFSTYCVLTRPLFPLLLLALLPVSLSLGAATRRRPIPVPAQPPSSVEPTLVPGSPPATIGRYQVQGELGRGAMGVVYKAVDPTIERPVAIKTIRLDQPAAGIDLQELRQRFLREAQVAGSLSHPAIVTVYDVIEAGETIYIAMEYIEGKELTHFCNPESLLPPRTAAAVVAHTCSALAYAHQRGIVHRDIKPGNIMLVHDGRPKIMDFGITKVISAQTTQTAAILGTPSYMAPEQIECKPLDHRADIFSLGVVFYELLTGERPFAADSIGAILNRVLTLEPPPPHGRNSLVPPALSPVVLRMLAKDRRDRFQSAAEVVAALKPLLADASIWPSTAASS